VQNVRVDAHHHVWDLMVRDQPWTAELPRLRRSFAIDELAPDLSDHRIDATVVVQTVPVAAETPELLALAAQTSVIAGVVGWVDLTKPDVGDQLSELRELPGGAALVGVRHTVQDEADPRWLQRIDVTEGLRAVADAGLVFDLLINAGQLDAAIRVTRELPELTFVLDHGGKPHIRQGVLQPWRQQITALAAQPNVAVKLSGLATEAGDGWDVDMLRPYADQLLSEFGAGRVMFGSDWPVCLLAGSYDDIMGAANKLTAHLGATERAAIFGGTAQYWYGLATPC
jgi:L-fuconolactonase